MSNFASIYCSQIRSCLSFYRASAQKIQISRLETVETQELARRLIGLSPHSIIMQKEMTELRGKVMGFLGLDPEFPLILVKKADYCEKTFINTLLNFDFTGVLDSLALEAHSSSDRKLFFLRTFLQSSHFPEILASLGSLISILLQKGLITQNFKVKDILIQEDELLMFISRKSMEALQIFKEEIHPSLIKGKGRSKEGFSLFNLFEALTSTSQGKKLLKTRMNSPSFDRTRLNRRLKEIGVFSSFSEGEIVNLQKSLSKIQDFVPLMCKFKEFRAGLEEWRRLKGSLDGVFQLVNLLQGSPETENLQLSVSAIRDILIEIPYDSLESLRAVINKCLKLTPDESSQKGGIEINPGVNEELDNLKRVFYQLDQFLELYSQDELEKLERIAEERPQAKKISSIGFSFFPQVGYLILIPKSDISVELPSISDKARISEFIPLTSARYTTSNDPQSNLSSRSLSAENSLETEENLLEIGEQELLLKHETITHLRENLPHRKLFHESLGLSEDWDFHFELEGFLYFKNEFTNELDSAYGDIYEQSILIEQEIVRALEEEVIKNSEYLLKLNDFIAEIDYLMAMAIAARVYNLKAPVLSEESIVLIRNGRHLLMEILLKKDFIPNDFVVYNYLDGYDNNFESEHNSLINKNYSNRVSILTGANFSGKSIFLKQIGLIVYLAQIGSFVPAEYCKIGLFDKILTNIHLNDSVSCGENGLEEEMSLFFENLRLATSRSLLLIDELGRNCSHSENLALFLATVKFLSSTDFPENPALEIPRLSGVPENGHRDFDRMKRQYSKIPISLLTTHLKDSELVRENYLVRYLEMKYVFLDRNQKPVEFERSEDWRTEEKNYESRLREWKSLNLKENKLVYLYKMKPGFSLNSFALFLANDLLNEEWIVQRASETESSILGLREIGVPKEIETKALDKIKDLIEKIRKEA